MGGGTGVPPPSQIRTLLLFLLDVLDVLALARLLVAQGILVLVYGFERPRLGVSDVPFLDRERSSFILSISFRSFPLNVDRRAVRSRLYSEGRP
jgi:hypothetical protein